MSDADDLLGCIGAVFAIVAIAIAVALVVAATSTAGVLYGGGIALRNYGLAFQHNVRPERRAGA